MFVYFCVGRDSIFPYINTLDFIGLIKSETWICGNTANFQWKRQGNRWGGLGTQSGKLTQTPPNNCYPGICREREEDVDQETPGAENLKQTRAGSSRMGDTWKQVQKLAKDRGRWKAVVGSLSPRKDRHK